MGLLRKIIKNLMYFWFYVGLVEFLKNEILKNILLNGILRNS